MRYSIIVLLLTLFVGLGLHISPAGAVAPTVSGETTMKPVVKPVVKTKAISNTLKKLILQRKIRETKSRIVKVNLAITTLEKKLETSKMTKLAYMISQKRLIILKKEKVTLEMALTALEKQLANLPK